MRRPEGDFERLAGRVLTRFLRAPVYLADDGSLDGMPDLRIEYSDGSTVYAEVVTDTDERYAQTYAELCKLAGAYPPEHPVVGSSRVWSVVVRVASVSRLLEALDHRLLKLEDQGRVFDWTAEFGPDDDPPERELRELIGLGVVGLGSRPTAEGEGGLARIYQDGVGGRPSWLAFFEWLECRTVAPDWQDVRDKLAASCGHERHLVIGVTFGTPGDAYFALSDRTGSLPDRAPQLPDEVTHLWLIPSSGMGRCLAWFPDLGWLDVTYGGAPHFPRVQ
jgi:hypothetical protein